MWVEALMALIVEGYREFLEWLQTRPRWPSRRGGEGGTAPSSAVAGGDPGVELRATVDAILDRHGRAHVGLVVGVWWDGETWTFVRGRLEAGRPEAPSPATIFEIGSVTKVFTALLLADMAAEGLVGLDDPVQRYLPAHVKLPVRRRPITLLDLATHSSGLPRLPKGLLRLSLRDRTNPYAAFTVGRLERAVRETRPQGPPGEKIRYSNFGFGLLGHVLALRAGRDYEQLVRERICDPLGLRDTSVSIGPESAKRFAQGHSRRGKPVRHWDLPTLAGAGALRSTLADLLCFVELQLCAPSTPLGVAARSTHEPRAKRGILEQCLGWASLPLRGSSLRMCWHNGGTGGFRSFTGFVAERRAGVVVLSNCARSVDAIGFRILESVPAPAADGQRTSKLGYETGSPRSGASLP
jgi:serine-type D-Ala-D-Ala carboxypeptidase/endopeptidase